LARPWIAQFARKLLPPAHDHVALTGIDLWAIADTLRQVRSD